MSAIRGDFTGFSEGYTSSGSGAGKVASSIDPTQVALAANSVKTATASMTSQFGAFLTIFSGVA